MEIVNQICQVCIIPLLGVLTGFLVKWLNAKAQEAVEQIDNQTGKKYIRMVNETITSCVVATNQTYVESLKASNSFDAEAQKIAFEKTYEAVMLLLSESAIKYLAETYGDVSTYLKTNIEKAVKENK